MKIITYERIRRAVASISATGSPAFRFGHIEAITTKVNSPYKSHGTIDFWRSNELPDGVLVASSRRYTLLITKSDSVPDTLLPPFPVNRLVMDWVGGAVPSWLVLPVIEKMRAFSMCPESIANEKTLQVYVLTPRLAGFHFTQPVFFIADKEKNERLVLEGEIKYEQGSLKIVKVANDLHEILYECARLNYWQRWAGSIAHYPVFFNHSFAPRERRLDDNPQWYLRPVAVMYNCRIYAMLQLWERGKITSSDHQGEEIYISDPTGLVALHPFPRHGID